MSDTTCLLAELALVEMESSPRGGAVGLGALRLRERRDCGPETLGEAKTSATAAKEGMDGAADGAVEEGAATTVVTAATKREAVQEGVR